MRRVVPVPDLITGPSGGVLGKKGIRNQCPFPLSPPVRSGQATLSGALSSGASSARTVILASPATADAATGELHIRQWPQLTCAMTTSSFSEPSATCSGALSGLNRPGLQGGSGAPRHTGGRVGLRPSGRFAASSPRRCCPSGRPGKSDSCASSWLSPASLMPMRSGRHSTGPCAPRTLTAGRLTRSGWSRHRAYSASADTPVRLILTPSDPGRMDARNAPALAMPRRPLADIWDTVSPHQLASMDAIEHRFGPLCDRIWSWERAECEAMRDRGQVLERPWNIGADFVCGIPAGREDEGP